jgi:hypothetical protein
MKRLFALASLLFALNASAADEMRRLDFLVGEWSGEAWIRMGPNAEHAIQTERVQKKAGGKALLIEGLGRVKLEDGKPGDVVHDALAVVSFDETSKSYRFDNWVADKPSAAAKLEVTAPNVVVWGFDTPQGGRVRYTIRLTDKGEWNEIGEFTRNGTEWMKFFEMTLTKK